MYKRFSFSVDDGECTIEAVQYAGAEDTFVNIYENLPCEGCVNYPDKCIDCPHAVISDEELDIKLAENHEKIVAIRDFIKALI